jgi:hypothetical protein
MPSASGERVSESDTPFQLKLFMGAQMRSRGYTWSLVLARRRRQPTPQSDSGWRRGLGAEAVLLAVRCHDASGRRAQPWARRCRRRASLCHRRESGPFQVLDDCKPGVDDCRCIASNRLDAVPIAFRYLPGHRPRRSAPGMDHSPMYGEALQCIQDYQNYLIAGITRAGLEHEATAMSDNDAAKRVQQSRKLLFQSINRRSKTAA